MSFLPCHCDQDCDVTGVHYTVDNKHAAQVNLSLWEWAREGQICDVVVLGSVNMLEIATHLVVPVIRTAASAAPANTTAIAEM